MVTFYKISSWIGAALFLITIASLQALMLKYTREMPQQPDVALRRTVSMKVLYGKTVYMTRTEEYRLYERVGWVAAAGGVTATMELLRRRAARRKKEPKA